MDTMILQLLDIHIDCNGNSEFEDEEDRILYIFDDGGWCQFMEI